MAPNEKPICDALMDLSDSWEQKALQMLDILRNYQSMQPFFEKVELTEDQKQSVIQSKVTELIDDDLVLPDVQELYDKVKANKQSKHFSNHDAFVDELLRVLSVYAKGLDPNDILALQANSSMFLIEKLVDENEVFTQVKATKTKQS